MKLLGKLPFYFLVFLLCVPSVGFGDTAQLLPRGVSNISVVNYNYFDITERYDPDGHAEDLAADYNTDLNSSVFPDLRFLEASFGGPLPDGTASLGQSIVDFTLQYNWWEIVYAYGVSDNFSLGILIPYNNSKNKVRAELDTSAATVGKFPVPAAYNPATDPPLIPIAGGGTPLTVQDIFDLLGKGLDINQDGQITGLEPVGFGYDPVKTWSGSNIGDIELLGKFGLSDSDSWRLAFTGGLRIPSGVVDDPDNLVDVPTGDGQMDVILRFHADYKGFEKLFLNGTVKYDVQLPDEEVKRVPDDVDIPLTSNKEKVDRDLGDILELELLGNYSLNREWSVGLKYRYTMKFKDDISGNQGFAYSSLEEETDFTSHMGHLLVGYSTVQKYLDKDTTVPLYVNLAYRDRFAGTNNVTKSQYLSLEFGMFF
jgi:hypothetical protein